MFLKRKTECLEEGVSLFVSIGGSYESDLDSVDARVLVDLDLREDDLLLDTKGIVALAVKLLLKYP